jgi:hypothetical protein
MDVDWKEFKERALQLPIRERALLAEHLIASLEEADDAEVERLWVEEAERRYREYNTGELSGRPAEEALRDARSSL